MTLHVFKSDDAREKMELLKQKNEEKKRDKFKKIDRKKRTVDLDASIGSPEEDIKNEMQRDWEKRTHFGG